MIRRLFVVSLRNCLKTTCVMLTCIFLAASCSGGFEPEPLAEEAAPTPASATEGSEFDGPLLAPPEPELTEFVGATLDLAFDELVDGPLDEEQFEKVSAWFDAFLTTRDKFFVGGAVLGDLEFYTSDRAFLAEMAEFQTEYVRVLQEGSIIANKEFSSFSNLSAAQIVRGTITFEDCTEQQTLSTIDIVGFRWITHRVVLQQTPRGWTMADIEIVHDGQPWTPGYGCAPSSFEQRALDLVQRLSEENVRYQTDPLSMPDDAFAMVQPGPFRDLYVETIERQQDEGIAVDSPEEFSYDVLGLDVDASLVNWAVAVDVCGYRPDGLRLRDLETGEVTQEPTVEPGFSLGFRLIVSLEPVADGETGTDLVQVVEPGDLGCWSPADE